MSGPEEEEATAVLEEVTQQTATSKSYTVTFKLQVVREAKLTTQRSAARHFGVDRKQVRAWMSNEDKLLGCPRTRRRLDGAGCKPAISEELEEELLQWLRQLRSARQRVTRKMLMNEASRLYRVHNGDGHFIASEGWLRRFMRRKQITLRRRTIVSQRLPSELASKISNHIRSVRNLRKVHNYRAEQIAAMDETGLWLDMPGNLE